MSRRRKWILGIALTVVAAGAVGYLVVLPAIVRGQVARALREAGVPAAEFSVRRVTLFSTRIERLASADRARVERVTISYSPATLLRGRVVEVRAEGLELRLDFSGGVADLGVIGDVLAHRDANRADQPAISSGPLPLDRVSIDSSILILKTASEEIRLPATGTLTVQHDGRLAFHADAQTQRAPLQIDGTFDPATGSADVRAHSAVLDVSGVMSILQSLLPLPETRMEGDVAMDARYRSDAAGRSIGITLKPQDLIARITYAHERVVKLHAERGVLSMDATWRDGVPAMSIHGNDLAIASQTYDARVDGVSFAAGYSPATQPATQPAVHALAVKSARVGKLVATEGSVRFMIDESGIVTIDHTRWHLLGGTIEASDIRLEPGRPIDAALSGRGLELRPLLEALGGGRVSGDGPVDVHLPVRIDWPRIGFGRGWIRGAEDGRLRIAEAQALADSVLRQAPGGGAEQDRLRRELVEAMQDFDYTRLEAQLRPEGEDLLMDARIAGRGRTGARRSFDLELHLRNVDDLVQVYLGLSGQMK
jgi:hypothetical protein